MNGRGGRSGPGAPGECEMERRDDACPSQSRHLRSEFDQGIAVRGAIGVIVLATEKDAQLEWRKVFTMSGIAVYESRIMSPRLISVESLAGMKKDIAYAAQLIQPGEPLDVLAYACTSGAMVIGEAAVFELMVFFAPRGRLYHADHRRLGCIRSVAGKAGGAADARCRAGQRDDARLS